MDQHWKKNRVFFCFWPICVIHFGSYVKAQQINTTTSPFLPNKVAATNYVNLKLISSIPGLPFACLWQKDDLTNILFEEASGCVPDVSNAEYSSVCEEDGSSINFSYTIRTPLRNDVYYGVSCSNPSISTTVKIRIEDCPSDIDEMLTVIPAGLPQYNATGELVCTNGGALFLNNVSVSNATMCNATAQWTTLDDIKCYTVPTDVAIDGIITAVEGLNVTLFCLFNESIPPVNDVMFFDNGQLSLATSGYSYSKILSRHDNSNEIRCRATNPLFDEINAVINFPSDGYSDAKTFNVTYKPYVAAFDARVECEARCNFTIDSNPFATFVSLENADGVHVYSTKPILELVSSETQVFSFENVMIPFSVNSTKIFLIVQSLYNVTVENTSLNFDVCNKTAGGCESSRLTTSYTSIITGMPPESVDQTIIIVVTTLAGVIAVALILVGVLCRKRKRNQRAEKQKNAGQNFNLATTSIMNQAASSYAQPKYLEIDNEPARPGYEEIGGYQNVPLNNPNADQQLPQLAGTSAPTYVNRNVINSETSYINASLQLSEKPHYVSMKNAENAESSQGDGGYETFEPMNQQPSTKK